MTGCGILPTSDLTKEYGNGESYRWDLAHVSIRRVQQMRGVFRSTELPTGRMERYS